MKRTKKFLVGFLACLSVFSGALGLVACGGSESPSIDKGATEGLHYQKIAGKDEYRVVGLGMAEETDVVISSTYKGLPVTEIGDMAFYVLDGAMSLTSITIPDGVKSIGDSAFYKCDSLTSIVIPDSVISIGDYAFSVCESLTYNVKNNLKYLGNKQNAYLYLADVSDTAITSATIESACKFIGDSAFYNCNNLTSIVIPNSVTSIGNYAFYGCSKLTSIVIPNSVTSIGNYAFYGCSKLTSIVIPDGVTSIGDYAFRGCSSLTSVEIPDSVTSIGNYAFSSCDGLTSIEIPDSVTSIGDSAFSYCNSLTSVVIPDSVTSIGKWAFSSCDSLTSVVIGDSVTSIGDVVFCDCISLTSVSFNGTKAQWNAIRKGSGWNYNVPATKVICSDGEVAL